MWRERLKSCEIVMSGDEAFALLAGGLLAAWSWYGWYVPAVSVQRLGAHSPGRNVVLWWPVVCALILFGVLKTISAHDVRDDILYLMLYMVLGAGWLGAVTKLLPFAGVSARDDVLERGNAAAVPAVAGALLACTLCFAGGNVGDGPGWWVVVFSAGLATAALGILWLLFDRITGISDTITVDRDRAAGVRLGGLLVAAGLVLGRAVAGDWVSASATVRDFAAAAWPALALFAIAAVLERASAPSPDRPVPSLTALGVLPAIVYIAVAAAYVVRLGPAW